MKDPIEVNGVIYDRKHIIEYAMTNDNKCYKKNEVITQNLNEVHTLLSVKKICKRARRDAREKSEKDKSESSVENKSTGNSTD